ncbi:hypothetical protein ABBQ38_013161 [Trebouxia sp. C0009 RCD-2024]
MSQHNLVKHTAATLYSLLGLQSFQCGKAVGPAHACATSRSGTGQGTATCSIHRNSPVYARRQTSSTAKAANGNSGNPDLASQSPHIEGCSNRSSTTPQSSKRKRSRKGDELPSLQDAPGLPERLGDQPLRLIIVGHNPSDHAWRSGHYYSNPSNWMWRILVATHIAPAHVTGPQHDGCMPADAGVGFTDVGSGIPGTHSSHFDSATFQSWGSAFYARLAAHVARACDSIGCKCGKCGAPALVAISGKRQWSELINTGRRGQNKITKFDVGPQSLRPEGWPLPAHTPVWVMTSTSGASPMTTEARMAPWHNLSQHLTQVSWPREVTCPANL